MLHVTSQPGVRHRIQDRRPTAFLARMITIRREQPAAGSLVRHSIVAPEANVTDSRFPSRPILSVLILALALVTGSARVDVPAPSLAPMRPTDDEPTTHLAMGNPAAVHCEDMGYDYDITIDGGQRGVCTMPNGELCDAWEFLQGTCGQRFSYCARHGYAVMTARDGKDPFSPEYAVCITSQGRVVGSVTTLSDLSDRATRCGTEADGWETLPAEGGGGEYAPQVVADLPASFDWREYGGSNWLSPIKDQGSCGSCWAFAAIGVAEAAHGIAGDDPNLDLDLSEQYLVSDCSSAGSCCGGATYSALDYIRSAGVPDEACMEYVDGDGCSCEGTCDASCTYALGDSCSDRTCSDRCADWSSRLEQVTHMGGVSGDPQVMKQALVDIGPLATSIGVLDAYGGYWDGDIYRCDNDSGVNHAVVIVGYDDAGEYWWVRNSWGTEWGEDGYFKLGYGECAIAWSTYYADAYPLDVGPLVVDGHRVDDDRGGDSDGDGDGVVDCGETIELFTTLVNEGSDTATDVSADLIEDSAYVTLTDAYRTFSNIPGGATSENREGYVFQVASDTPDGHVIPFELDISASNAGPWSDSFEVEVACQNTAPDPPADPSPADGALDVSVDASLSWTGDDPDPGDTLTYDVYFGSSDSMPLLCDAVDSSICTPDGLSYATAYSWYVVARDDHGGSTTGDTWHFTTQDPAPGSFSKASPLDGAVGQPTDPSLSWATSDGAESYEVCVDTTDDATCDRSWTSVGAGTSTALRGLSPGTTYYWQARATNGTGTTEANDGAWWRFTTESDPFVVYIPVALRSEG